MSAMNRRSAFLLASLGFSLLCASAFANGSDVEQHLRDQYQGKTFVLRGFYSDDKLQFDSTGAPVGNPRHSDWTSDGFISVKNIHISGQRLIIEATRKIVLADQSEKTLRLHDLMSPSNKKPITLKIESDLGTGEASAEVVDAYIGRLFLTARDSFTEQIPQYWRPCILAEPGSKGGNCQLSPEITAVPGLSPLTNNGSGASAAIEDADGVPMLKLEKVQKGVTPPTPLTKPDPSYSERARMAKIQGSLVLSLVVNKDGHPGRIYIVSPLGCGLDDMAVHTVAGWRFTPARKDGESIPVEIAVEMDFHLY